MGRMITGLLFLLICSGIWASDKSSILMTSTSPEVQFNESLDKLKNDRPELSIQLIREYLNKNPWDGEAWKILKQARTQGEFKDPGGQAWWYGSWEYWGPIMATWMATTLLVWTAVRIYRSRSRPWLPLLFLVLLVPMLTSSPLPQGGQLRAVFQGRKGDGDFYPPAQNSLWAPGQELWIWESRAAWVRVQVGSVTAWVPQDLVRRF